MGIREGQDGERLFCQEQVHLRRRLVLADTAQAERKVEFQFRGLSRSRGPAPCPLGVFTLNDQEKRPAPFRSLLPAVQRKTTLGGLAQQSCVVKPVNALGRCCRGVYPTESCGIKDL